MTSGIYATCCMGVHARSVALQNERFEGLELLTRGFSRPKPTKTILKVILEMVLDVLEMLLEVLELSWRS